jgi:hypothetical protein
MLDGINNKLIKTEDRTTEFKDRTIKIIQAGAHKEKRI